MGRKTRARIEELERLVRERDKIILENNQDIKTLEIEKATLMETLEKTQLLLDTTPSDCKLGEYCKGCVHAKTYHVRDDGWCHFKQIVLCNKQGGCKNFVQMEHD